jgi:DNA-binding SARP family transcriptional activator
MSGGGSRGGVRGGPDRTITGGQIAFTLLGPLEIRKGDVDHAPTAPKVLQLMAVLVLNPGRVVHVDTIVRELWDGRPPRSVRTTMQTYIYQLRRCIDEHGLAEDAEHMLGTRAPGYVLRISPEQVDVERFRRLAHEGRAHVAAGRNEAAGCSLEQAVALWSGPPLANIACGPVLSAHAVDLQEQLRDVRHLRVEAAIARGTHRELVGELRVRASVDPLDEDLHGQLIRVLARSGRRSEAMSTYRDLRNRLVGQLGVEPSSALQSLHLDLLSDAA